MATQQGAELMGNDLRIRRRKVLREILATTEGEALAVEDIEALLAERGLGGPRQEIWWDMEAVREGHETPRRAQSGVIRRQKGTGEAAAFAQAIRHLRGSRTQAEVAEAGDLNPATWSAYESGRRVPREENIGKILQGLGCSHLQLEETAWRFRREQLLAKEAPEDLRLVEAAVQSAAASLRANRKPEAGLHPFRQKLRALLLLFEDLLVDALVRDRPPAGEGEAAAREGEPS